MEGLIPDLSGPEVLTTFCKRFISLKTLMAKLHRGKAVTAAIGLLLGAAALVVFLIRVAGHRGDILESVRMFRYEMTAPALLAIALMFLFRIVRWKLLLKSGPPVSWKRVTNALFISILANNVLPARVGEIIRPYVLQRGSRMSFNRALASVAVDRIFDISGVALLVLIAAIQFMFQKDARPTFLQYLPESLIARGLLVALFLVPNAALVGLLLFPGLCRRAAMRPAKTLPGIFRKPAENFLNFLTGYIAGVRNRYDAALVLFLSAAVFLLQSISVFFLTLGFGLEIGFAGAVLATLAVSFAIALPQAPGYLGTYHLVAALTVESFDVAPAPAAAFAVLMWVVNIVPVSCAGVISLISEGLELSELKRGADTVQQAD